MSGCALVAEHHDAPSYQGRAPTIERTAYAEHRAEYLIDLSPEVVRQLFDRGKLEASLPANPKIARPISSENIIGRWPSSPARRRVLLDDGSYVAEDILFNDYPARLRYQSWGFSSKAGGNVSYTISDYQFLDDENGGTRIVWIYQMKAKNSLVQGFLNRFVENDFAPFMDAGLARFASSTKRGRE